MSIPLRELLVILSLVPAAMGGATAFNAGVSRFDAFLFECDRLENDAPRSCSQENLLMAWDVQLQLTAESRRNERSEQASPGEMALLASEPL